MDYGKFVAGCNMVLRERIMLVLFQVIGCHDVPLVNGSSTFSNCSCSSLLPSLIHFSPSV